KSDLTLEDVGITLTEVGENNDLVPLTLSSTITSETPEVGSYVITASHPQTSITFSDFFNYVGVLQENGSILYDGTNNALGNYGPGILKIEGLPITIKPVDLTGESSLKYGESISEKLKFEIIIPQEFIES
ncbi:hypothetical protein, partial [Christiangramia aquimixticola]